MKILKEHIKALLWIGLYFILQIASMAIIFVAKLLTDKEFLVKMNYNLLTSEITKLEEEMYKIALPSLISTAIIVIIIFTIYLYITKNYNIIKKIKPNSIFKYCLIAIIANLIISIIITLIPESIYTIQLDDSTNLALNGSFITVLLGTGILVPILEEIVFRFGLSYHLSKINKRYGLIIQAIIFGAMHGNLIQGIYAGLLGLLFGYVDEKEQSLIPSIIMHITINSSSVIVTYLPINQFCTMSLILIFLFLAYKISKIVLKDKK